ncbi:MAG: DUF4126 domain-containing protein [Desulfuromonadales bacterium]
MQEAISTIALSMGIAWASGINLYAAVVVLGLLGAGGYMDLPETLQVLQNPVVIGASVIIYCVEFIADKVPVVDNAWDTVHTFIRIPAGAVLAASAVGDVDPSLTMAAALVGGTITAGTHLTKASSRLMVNTSPEPFSNIGVSLVEDVVVVAGVWTALFHPAIFLIFLISFILLMIWLLPILGRAVKNIFETLQKMFKPDRDKSLPEA